MMMMMMMIHGYVVTLIHWYNLSDKKELNVIWFQAIQWIPFQNSRFENQYFFITSFVTRNVSKINDRIFCFTFKTRQFSTLYMSDRRLYWISLLFVLLFPRSFLFAHTLAKWKWISIFQFVSREQLTIANAKKPTKRSSRLNSGLQCLQTDDST